MKALLSFLLVFMLAACARPTKPVWTELPSSSTLLQLLEKTTGQVTAIDGAATVNLTVAGKFLSSQQFLLLEKPDRLRADVLTGFGQLIMQMTSDGTELAVLSNASVPGRFYRGPATDENLSRFTRIPLASRDMLRLLLYDPPVIAFRQSAVREDAGQLVLQLIGAELQQELLFNEQLLLSGCRYYSNGSLLLEVLYRKIENERVFPREIRIDVASEKTQVVLKFSELVLNSEIPLERFRLPTPENIPVEDLP